MIQVIEKSQSGVIFLGLLNGTSIQPITVMQYVLYCNRLIDFKDNLDF